MTITKKIYQYDCQTNKTYIVFQDEFNKIKTKEVEKSELLGNFPITEIIKELQWREKKGEIRLINDGEKIKIIDWKTEKLIAYLS